MINTVNHTDGVIAMAANALVTIRIDGAVKEEAATVLVTMGLTVSQDHSVTFFTESVRQISQPSSIDSSIFEMLLVALLPYQSIEQPLGPVQTNSTLWEHQPLRRQPPGSNQTDI